MQVLGVGRGAFLIFLTGSRFNQDQRQVDSVKNRWILT